jgi:hypothetical protein
VIRRSPKWAASSSRATPSRRQAGDYLTAEFSARAAAPSHGRDRGPNAAGARSSTHLRIFGAPGPGADLRPRQKTMGTPRLR